MISMQVRRDGLCVCLCTAIGYVAWGHDLIEVSLLFPWVWALVAQRGWAFIAALGYYLAGTRCLPASSVAFFAGDGSWIEACVHWFASATLNALPWLVVFARGRSWHEQMLRVLVPVVLLALPPFGVVAWLHPLLAAALVVPGMGLGSLAIGAGLVAASGIASSRGAAKVTPHLLVCAVLLTCTTWFVRQPIKSIPDGWLGEATQGGAFPTQPEAQVARLRDIVGRTNAALSRGAKVVVFPEQYAGQLTAPRLAQLNAALGQTLRDHQAEILIGGSLPLEEDSPAVRNVAAIYNGNDWRFVAARHAVPIAMWVPFSKSGTMVDWFDSGRFTLGARSVSLSICMEDYVIWPHVVDLLAGKPDLIVSIANQWWAGDSSEPEVQRQHIEAWARIVGVPLVRSANLPTANR